MKLIDFEAADSSARVMAQQAAHEFWTKTKVRMSMGEFELLKEVLAVVAVRHLDTPVGECERQAYKAFFAIENEKLRALHNLTINLLNQSATLLIAHTITGHGR